MTLWHNTATISGAFTMCQALCQPSRRTHKEGQLLYSFYRSGNWVICKLNNLPHILLAFNLCMSNSTAHQNAPSTQMYPQAQVAYINRAPPGLARSGTSNTSGTPCTSGPLLDLLLLPRREATRPHRSPEHRDLDPCPLVGNGPKLKTNTLK